MVESHGLTWFNFPQNGTLLPRGRKTQHGTVEEIYGLPWFNLLVFPG